MKERREANGARQCVWPIFSTIFTSGDGIFERRLLTEGRGNNEGGDAPTAAPSPRESL